MTDQTPPHIQEDSDSDEGVIEDIITPEDIEPPPQDILDEIDLELDLERGGDNLEIGLVDPHQREKSGPTYGEDMTRCAMTTLRKFVYVKNKYLTKLEKAKRQAQLRIKSTRSLGDSVGLTSDIKYLAERLEIQGEFQLQVENLSVLLLKPEQFWGREKPLTATKVHRLSEAYGALMFSDGFLPFKPDKNEYLMRVKKTVDGGAPTFKISKINYSEEGRVVLAAGLAMINYYSGQGIKMPYTIHLFEGHDAIRVAGLITEYTLKEGVAGYSALENYVRWCWPEAVFSLYHCSLPIEDKPYMKFLLSHILARLVFTDVFEGRLEPIKTKDAYRAGLYFTISPKYMEQKVYKQNKISS